ncbi:MAG: fibronectin type III domain-containing protein [Patescibacteria group bacterium]
MQDKNKKPIKHEKRHHKWLLASLKSPRSVLLMVVLLTAFGGGIYSIIGSKAATRTYGNFHVYVYNSQNPAQTLNGAYINVESYDPATGQGRGNTCSGQQTTVINGSAYFSDCIVHSADGVVLQYRITAASYSNWRATPAGGFCATGVGNQIIVYSNTTYALSNTDVHFCMTPPSPPGPPAITTADRTQTSLTLRWNAGSGAEGYSTFKNSATYGSTSYPYYTFANLACGTTYTLGVQSYASGLASGTVSQAFTTTACTVNTPAPPPQSPIVGGSGGGTTTTKNTSTASRTVARAPSSSTTPAVTANTDKQAPTAPTDLSAVEGTSGGIDLSWAVSTDDTAVTGYVIERSDDDGTTWTTLSDSATDTTYNDNTTEFSAKYTYRVSATDAAGNASDYSVADITTSSFSANAFADKESTIESDDGVVSVKIPAGALNEDAACEIDQTNDKTLSKSNNVLAGTYELVCKSSDGSQVDKFNKPVQFKVAVNKKLLKDKPQLYAYNGSKWTNSKLKLDSDHNFNFSTDSPKPFAVVGASSGMVWWKILLGLFLLIGAIYGVFTWIRRRKQLTSYYDSLNAQYAAPTPIGVATPVVGNVEPVYPLGQQPVQSVQPVADQQIGHRTLFSPAIGSAAQQPVPNPNDPFAQPQQQPPNGQQPPQYPPQQQ